MNSLSEGRKHTFGAVVVKFRTQIWRRSWNGGVTLCCVCRNKENFQDKSPQIVILNNAWISLRFNYGKIISQEDGMAQLLTRWNLMSVERHTSHGSGHLVARRKYPSLHSGRNVNTWSVVIDYDEHVCTFAKKRTTDHSFVFNSNIICFQIKAKIVSQ